MPQGTWDLHSLTRHLTHVPSPAPEVQSSNGLPGKSQNTVTFKVYFLNSLKTFYLVVLLFSGKIHIRSDQIRSVAQSCPTLCDPMNCSTPGLPVHHQLPEFTQTHV